ncbi:pancreatic lipase-related protein 2 [Nilaparvata lugens]|uniref:pancreatic lipase-related protein 2 n=1 Tax=Nilaparvata lugens TaxID=108931 RepID=UPI00193E7E96|nr:pancreatic lipase-related protein 2 [Nilaparvata lugens]
MHCLGMLACFTASILPSILWQKVCYNDVGCFPTGHPWRTISIRERWFIPPPQSPRDVDVTVTFFARNTGLRIENRDLVYLRGNIYFKDSDFDASRNKTFFIIHGFIDKRKADWLRIMKNELLKKEDANVFIVDWGRGLIDLPRYKQAVSNTRIAGAELARFIKLLNKEYNLQPGNIHLIGHSLGAHVASYAAKESMKGRIGRIGRITGLDPAQPGFEGTPIEVRLDKTDALFVDVYHTNTRPFRLQLGFGMIDPVGHVDIYYNGGRNQPGCGLLHNDKPFFDFLDDIKNIPNNALLTCSHLRAHEYFTESINNEGCDVWAGEVKFLFGNSVKWKTLGGHLSVHTSVEKCSPETCTIAGYKADTPGLRRQGVFAATTRDHAPFCDPNHGGMTVDKNILSKMERYTGDESTIEISSEIPQVATMENDDMDEQADDFMFTSESGSQYFNEDDLYEIVTSRH